MTVTIVKRKPAIIKLVRYHTWKKAHGGGYESAVRSAFVKAGRKWLKVLAIDATLNGGLRVWRVPTSDQQYMRPLLLRGKPYPVARALKAFRRMAKSHGVSNGAKRLLREVSSENKTTKKAAASTGDNA